MMLARQMAERTDALTALAEPNHQQVVALMVSVGHLLRQTWAHEAQIVDDPEKHAALAMEFQAAAQKGLRALSTCELPEWTTLAISLSEVMRRLFDRVTAEGPVDPWVAEIMYHDPDTVTGRLRLLREVDDLLSAVVTLKVLGRQASVEACLIEAERLPRVIALDLYGPLWHQLEQAVTEAANDRQFHHDPIGKIVWLAIIQDFRDVPAPVSDKLPRN